MTITVAGLKAAIKSAQEAAYGTPDSPTEEDKFAGAVADAIVNYLKANVEVSVNITGTVTSGVGSGGAITGTGTGTIS